MSDHTTATTAALPRQSELDRLQRADHAPRCAHVKLNGIRCGSPAMRKNVYCYFHHRWLNQPFDDTFPPFEDGNSVQFALMQIVERLRREAFRGGGCDPRFVKALIFAVKTAAQNLRNTSFDPLQEQSLLVDPIDIPMEHDQAVTVAPGTFNPPERAGKKTAQAASEGDHGITTLSTGD